MQYVSFFVLFFHFVLTFLIVADIQIHHGVTCTVLVQDEILEKQIETLWHDECRFIEQVFDKKDTFALLCFLNHI